jgi:hypothetical protein
VVEGAAANIPRNFPPADDSTQTFRPLRRNVFSIGAMSSRVSDARQASQQFSAPPQLEPAHLVPIFMTCKIVLASTSWVPAPAKVTRRKQSVYTCAT